MRMLMTCPNLGSGAGIARVVVNWANVLAHRPGWTVGVSALAGTRDRLGPGVEWLPASRWRRGTYRVFASPWLGWAARRLARRVLRRFRPDVVNVHYPPYDRVFAELKAAYGYRLVYMYHNVTDPALYEGPDRQRRLAEDRAIRALLPRCDLVTTNSAFTAAKLQNEDGVACEVVWPGVDGDAFAPVDRSGRPARPIRLIHVGRVDRHKGVHLLLDAFAQARLDIVGRVDAGPYGQEIGDRVSGMDGVRLCGELPHAEMVAALHQADLFVCASVYEGYGLPFLEAQATGLPCVGFRTSAIPEVVCDGRTGRLVRSGDSEALADAIVALANSPEQRQRMGTAAVAWAAQRTWQACGDRFAGAVEGRPAPAGEPTGDRPGAGAPLGSQE